MAHYLFNLMKTDPTGQSLHAQAAAFLHSDLWPVAPTEPHAQALEPGDLVLIYLGPPDRVFIARAELASPAQPRGVLLAHIEQWDPPIPMQAVLARIPPTENAKADFQQAVVRITAIEYESALAVARG